MCSYSLKRLRYGETARFACSLKPRREDYFRETESSLKLLADASWRALPAAEQPIEPDLDVTHRAAGDSFGYR